MRKKPAFAILDAFVPETWLLNRYMNKKNGETKVGDSYVIVFDQSQIVSVSKEGMKALKDVGDYVVTLFDSSPKGMKMAVKAWKEYVALAQNGMRTHQRVMPRLTLQRSKRLILLTSLPKRLAVFPLPIKDNGFLFDIVYAT